MSSIMGAWRPAGAAHDHGFVPTRISVPPQGAIARLTLVEMKPTHPAKVANLVKYIAVPKCPEFRTATAPMPNFLHSAITLDIAECATT